jgi:hypothetical protein
MRVMAIAGKLRKFVRVLGIAAGLSFSLLTVTYAANPVATVTGPAHPQAVIPGRGGLRPHSLWCELRLRSGGELERQSAFHDICFLPRTARENFSLRRGQADGGRHHLKETHDPSGGHLNRAKSCCLNGRMARSNRRSLREVGMFSSLTWLGGPAITSANSKLNMNQGAPSFPRPLRKGGRRECKRARTQASIQFRPRRRTSHHRDQSDVLSLREYSDIYLSFRA